jgi:hypothetical protein
MTNETPKQCKSKGCYNPVLGGKYCVQCKQNRKEKRDKILAGALGAAILGGGGAIKKVAIKQAPKIAAKVIQIILRK